MDYNLAGLRQRVLVDKLDDDEFDPQIVDNFLNDTLRDIYNQYELPFQEKIFEGTIPAGITMFDMPNDMALMQSQTIRGITGFNSRQIDWRTFFQIYTDIENETPGEPLKWTLYGGKMIFNRPTDKEYSMTSFYIKRPLKLLLNTDVPELPSEFEELLILGAFMRILDRNEDYDLSSIVEGQYNKHLLQLVNRYGFREADGPIKMKIKQRK